MGKDSGRRAEPRRTVHRSVDSEHEFDLFPAVKNGYIDSCIENDLFDLTYADLGQPKPNFVCSAPLSGRSAAKIPPR